MSAEGASRKLNRFLDGLRDVEAFRAAGEEGTAADLSALEGHQYCLLVSFRRSGEPIPTPVWFGLGGGNAYFHTRERNAKVRRIRRNPHVLVGPCSFRGKPLGPLAEGRARVLPKDEEAEAEAALRSNYGIARRVYYATVGSRGAPSVYLEVSAAGAPV